MSSGNGFGIIIGIAAYFGILGLIPYLALRWSRRILERKLGPIKRHSRRYGLETA